VFISKAPVRTTLLHSTTPSLELTHKDTSFRLCVSIPPKYPEESPPQLQLLSRYIGSFGVDADLFGAITRTFISSAGVSWSPGDVSVFDGIESVRSLVLKWYETHLGQAKAVGLAREYEAEERLRNQGVDNTVAEPRQAFTFPDAPELPSSIEITESLPIKDRGSVFVGRVCRIEHSSQVPLIIESLRSERHIARAAHPTINAWRCTEDGVLHQDNDDDGETAAGSRLAHLLQILGVDHVLVVVTRYFGGVLLGADRFKHINQCARDALELGGFLDERGSRKSTRRRM